MTDALSPSRRDGDRIDQALVHSARQGRREALEELVRRHQGFIYNLALRMVWEPAEAEDLTQEILVKLVTALSSYRGESAFRTWTYRIAANHLLDARRGRVEETITGFDCYGRALDATADEDIPDACAPSPEEAVLAEEVKVGCTTGMLLCLDRHQRLVFVLGDILEVSDGEGAAVLGTSRANFRQRLSRARRQIHAFMARKCGLADPANPCRCARKTRGFIRAGIVDPANLRFTRGHLDAVEAAAPARARELDEEFARALRLIYRRQPKQECRDLVGELRAIIDGPALRRLLALEAGQS
jgi:RNA polymerase sigma factor (sigma-70 family)